MDKLISTQNGGIPLEWNDFRWEGDAIRDAFYGFLSSFGVNPATDNFICSGCTISGANMTAGYVCLAGEIYKVDAQVIPIPGVGQQVFFQIQISYDPAGDEIMYNTVLAQTYQKRRASLVAGTYTGAELLFSANTRRLPEIITRQLKTTTSSISPVPVVSGGGAVTGSYSAIIQSVGHQLLVSASNLILNISGTVNSIAIDITGFLTSGMTGGASFVGFYTNGGNSYPCQVIVGAPGGIDLKPIGTTNFPTGACSFYYTAIVLK